MRAWRSRPGSAPRRRRESSRAAWPSSRPGRWPRPWSEEGLTLAPKVDREFGRLDWGDRLAGVLRRIRAATPAPGAHTELRLGEGADVRRLRILRATAASDLAPPDRPGRLRSDGRRLWISALDGWVEVLTVQEVGRKPLAAGAYLRGARLPPDEEVEAR
jgi:methionyl-tRNA formyltransferase